MRFRQVHLDFHTSEAIPAVGADFDKRQFQDALKQGHVDSITVFSKCHHGWSYHPTSANKMHPTLTFDLLKAQIEAAHEIGVKTPVYLSAGVDEKYAVEHPEDLVREKNGAPLHQHGFLEPGYHRLCFNSKYLDVLAEQVKEVCRNYDADGIFLDITSPPLCYCQNCVAKMKREGVDINNAKEVTQFAEQTYMNYAAKMREAIDSVKLGLPLFHNSGATPRGRRGRESTNSHNEIESLPTSAWGYDNLPVIAKYVQYHNKEYLAMTGKFHKGWGEFGGYKHKNALIYETALAVSFGAKCSIGDQLHPRGRADSETYRLIGEAYKRIEEREPWLDNVTPISDIAVYSYEAYLVSHPNAKVRNNAKTTDVGAARLLLDGHYLFNIVDDDDDLTPYKILVLPDAIELDDALKAKFDAYVKQGGKILASGYSAVDANGNIPFKLGAVRDGENKVAPAYATPETELSDIGRAGYILYEAPTHKVTLADGATELASMRLPYFERTYEHFCSHLHAPECPDYAGAAVTLGDDGAYFSFPVCFEYANVGTQFVKQMFIATVDMLLGEKKSVTTSVPTQASVSLMDQKDENRLVFHIVYAPRNVKGMANKIEIIEDSIPIYNTPVCIRVGDKKIKRVYTAPDGVDVSFTQDGELVSFNIDKFEMHAMIILDY